MRVTLIEGLAIPAGWLPSGTPTYSESLLDRVSHPTDRYIIEMLGRVAQEPAYGEFLTATVYIETAKERGSVGHFSGETLQVEPGDITISGWSARIWRSPDTSGCLDFDLNKLLTETGAIRDDAESILKDGLRAVFRARISRLETVEEYLMGRLSETQRRLQIDRALLSL